MAATDVSYFLKNTDLVKAANFIFYFYFQPNMVQEVKTNTSCYWIKAGLYPLVVLVRKDVCS